MEMGRHRDTQSPLATKGHGSSIRGKTPNGGNAGESAKIRKCANAEWLGSAPVKARERGAQAENDEPHPQVLFTFGLENLKPEPWSPST